MAEIQQRPNSLMLTNNGFARIESISAAGVLTLDKTSGGAGGQTEMENEGPIAACELYFGTSYRNVSAITNRYKFPPGQLKERWARKMIMWPRRLNLKKSLGQL